MSLSSYLFERHQGLAHHLQERLSDWRNAYRRMQNNRRPALCDMLEPRMLMSGLVTYIDSSGDTVTVKLTGAGDLVVNGVTDSSQVDATGIVLSGTTTKSSLTITVKTADNKSTSTTSIGSINIGTGQLASLSAGNVDLTGAGLICDSSSTNSYINAITLRDLTGGADILLNYNTTTIKSTTKIVARVVGDGSDITLSNAISSATFADVGDGTISATKLSTLKVTGIKNDATYVGNFDADITLTGTSGTVLGSVNIAGSVSAATWSISTGGVGSSLKVGGSFAADLTISKIGAVTIGGNFSGSLILGAGVTSDSVGVMTSLTVAGAMTGEVSSTHGGTGTIKGASATGMVITFTNGTVNKIDVTNAISAGSITVGRLGSLKVGGDLGDISINLTITGKTGYTVLNSITVGGSINATNINAVSGGLGSLKVTGSITASSFSFAAGRVGSVYVGNDMSGGFETSGTYADTIKAISIGSWTVKGDMDDVVATIGTDSKLDGKNALDKLTVTGAISDTSITATYGGSGAISGASMAATSLYFANGNISSITSASSQNGGTIKARAIGTWSVATDMIGVTATLAETKDMKKNNVLTKLTVGGNLNDTIITAATGQVGTITAGAIKSSELTFTAGRINTLKTTSATDDLTLTALSLGTWTVGGNMSDVTATLGSSSSLKGYYTITDMLVTGDMTNVDVSMAYGGIRTLSAKSISDGSSFTMTGRINKLTTTSGNVADSTFTAETIGTWTVAGAMSNVVTTLGSASVTNKMFSLEKLTVSGAMTSTTITASAGAAGDISAQSMSGGAIIFSAGSIRSLKISGDMAASDNTTTQLQATSIGTWTVGGNLTKTKAVFGASDGKEYYALGTLTVSGIMTDVNLSSAEDGAQKISAASISGGTLSFAASTIGQLSSTGATDDLTIQAKTLQYWNVGGDLTGSTANLGNSATENTGSSLTDVLWYLVVGGNMDQTNIYADGTINSITTKTMSGSTILAGYTDSGSGYTLHTNEEIVSLKVTGNGEGSFTGNTIMATWIDTLNAYDPNSSAITLNAFRALQVTQYSSGSSQVYSFGGGSSWINSTPANSATALQGLTLTWVDEL